MEKPTFTPDINHLDYSIDKNSIEGYKSFIEDVKANGIRSIRCGQFNYLSGEDYMAMPVRLTSNSNQIYQFSVALALDPLEESDEEMITMVVADVETRIQEYEEDYEKYGDESEEDEEEGD